MAMTRCRRTPVVVRWGWADLRRIAASLVLAISVSLLWLPPRSWRCSPLGPARPRGISGRTLRRLRVLTLLIARALLIGCGWGGAPGPAVAAETLELTMELHPRWHEIVVFRVPVEAGRPFHAEEMSGSVRHAVSGTVGPLAEDGYPVTLRLSRWANQRLASLQVLTVRVAPRHRWLGTTGPLWGDHLLTVTLAPAESADGDPAGSHETPTSTD